MRKQKRTQTIIISFKTFDDIKALRKLKRQGYTVQALDWDKAILTK
jgi:hypothetical protein